MFSPTKKISFDNTLERAEYKDMILQSILSANDLSVKLFLNNFQYMKVNDQNYILTDIYKKLNALWSNQYNFDEDYSEYKDKNKTIREYFQVLDWFMNGSSKYLNHITWYSRWYFRKLIVTKILEFYMEKIQEANENNFFRKGKLALIKSNADINFFVNPNLNQYMIDKNFFRASKAIKFTNSYKNDYDTAYYLYVSVFTVYHEEIIFYYDDNHSLRSAFEKIIKDLEKRIFYFLDNFAIYINHFLNDLSEKTLDEKILIKKNLLTVLKKIYSSEKTGFASSAIPNANKIKEETYRKLKNSLKKIDHKLEIQKKEYYDLCFYKYID